MKPGKKLNVTSNCGRLSGYPKSNSYLFAAFTFAHRAFCARLIFLRAAADKVGLAPLPPVMPVRALIAASKRSRSCCSSLTICSIGMAGF